MSKESDLTTVIEALLFLSGQALTLKEISQLTAETPEEVHQAVNRLKSLLDRRKSALTLVRDATGIRMATRPEFSEYRELLGTRVSRKIPPACLEVLSIIAFRQPITLGEIEQIRKAASGNHIRNLLDLGIIKVNGLGGESNRARLFVTTRKFLSYFGLNHLDDLKKQLAGLELISKEITDSPEDLIKEQDPELTPELKDFNLNSGLL